MAAAGWPTPNFVDPPDRVPLFVGIEVPFAVLMTVAVLARFYSRAVLRNILQWDDWLIVVAWGCLLAVSITSMYSVVHLNLSRHIWDIKPAWVSVALKINLAFELLYPLGVAFTKISICLNYLRIFPMQTFNDWFCKGMMAYSVCWAIAIIVPQMDQYVNCPPVTTGSSIKINRDCINQKAFLIATAALNSASDLTIFLWPARYLWGMHVPREQRLGLIGLFCVGVIICVAGVIRMWYLTVWFKTKDPYWDGVWNYLILAIETNVGIICACLPCCKPLMVQLCPCLFSNSSSRGTRSSRRRQEQQQNQNELGGGGLNHADIPQPAPRRQRSWSLWGTGTTLTTTRGTGTQDSALRSIGKSQDNKSQNDTVILMDDLGHVVEEPTPRSTGRGFGGYDGDGGDGDATPRHHGAYDDVDDGYHVPDSLQITPQRSATGLHPGDLETGFHFFDPELVSPGPDGHPGRRIMP